MRSGIAVALEPDVLLPEFLPVQRNRGHEITHDPFNRVAGHAPDAEKTEDMIDPERVEVMADLLEALPPPTKTVFLHSLPIISRETPILAFRRKRIRWRPRLHVQIV